MARINLLPWRERLRQQRKKEFYTVVAVAMALMAGVVFGAHLVVQSHIDFQLQKNSRLQQEIAIFDGMITKINELQKAKENLIQQMDIIESLQIHRPEVVHLFDELVVSIPEGLYLTSLKQGAGTLTLEGIAQSNARVSAFMRSLDSSEWFADPNLQVIRANTRGVDRTRQFVIVVKQTSPLLQSEEAS
ncbi:pilus assembly protein PilN [Ectothiorhodospiraceae bacterium BW-2]|nr:pilus assembly protein PilN [Ectothiorhodospiraceae bacterium BW-2]